MTLSSDSSEFADLVARWLDETATADEAAQLWLCVTQCPDCARELAAASRFEAMLGDTVRARNVEAEARQILATTPRVAKTTTLRKTAATVSNQPSMKWIAVAAALVVLGLITAMLWPEEAAETPKMVQEKAVPMAQPSVHESRPLIAHAPAPKSDPLVALSAATAEVPLTDRLDRFFLHSVSLDQVPLSQALGLLQGLLKETDYMKTLDLTKLRIHVPAGASARRVTFYSGAIPFLKAVRSVAALAGCDVLVSEPEITLTMQSGIFPQLAEKRTLSDMLAGRLNADGTAMVDDADRLAGLWEDAATLGIAVNEDGTAAISRGQWEALRMMSAARDQVGRIPMPAFAVYVVPQDPLAQNKVLTPEEIEAFQRSILDQGAQPLATFTPQLAGPNNLDPVVLDLNGEEGELALQSAANAASQSPQNSGPQQTYGLVRTTIDSVSTSGLIMQRYMGGSTHLTADQMSYLTGTTTASVSNIRSASTTVVIIAVPTP
ncbi:MAG: hypothetical protein ABL974_07895 [Prosthecobacter sp.]